MAWKVIWTDEVDADLLTNSELIGIGVLLGCYMGEPQNEHNVYWRAWDKLGPAIHEARERDEDE